MGGLSLTSVMFVFQACYGTPQDFGMDVFVEGQVKSVTTGLPIQGVKVSVPDQLQYEFTNEEGFFSFYTILDVSIALKIQDVDSTLNGLFIDKDIVVSNVNAEDRVYLNIELQEK